jgi:HEPN domain-containing protein
MNTPRALTLTAVVALALILAGCEADGPTLPEMGDAEAQAAAALDQGAMQAQALVEESLGRMPEGLLPVGRADRERPDSVRPERERPDSVRGRPDHSRRAELAIALALESIELADRMLEGTTPSEEQLRFLQHAQGLLRRAEHALEAGRPAAAVELAEAAQIAALKAVVLPRGISDEEARAIHDAAKDLLRQAHEAVGGDATEIERHLLALADRLFQAGSDQLAKGTVRGVVALWKSAAISSFLIG